MGETGKGCLVMDLGLARFIHEGVDQGGELGLMIDSHFQSINI